MDIDTKRNEPTEMGSHPEAKKKGKDEQSISSFLSPVNTSDNISQQEEYNNMLSLLEPSQPLEILDEDDLYFPGEGEYDPYEDYNPVSPFTPRNPDPEPLHEGDSETEQEPSARTLRDRLLKATQFSTWEELQANVVDIDSDELDEEERLKWIKRDIYNCRKYFFAKVQGFNGRMGYKPFLCKHTHGDGSEKEPVCPQCLEARGISLREQMLQYREEGGLIAMDTMTEDEQKKFMRKFGKDNVFCLPQLEDDTFVVFYEPEAVEDALSDDEFEEIDWTEIARTPKGRRASGKLGVPEKLEEDPNDYFIYSTKYVCTDLNPELRNKAEELAVWDTIEYNYELLPENVHLLDADKIQSASNERVAAYEKRIIEMGGEITYTGYHIVRTFKDEIDWFIDLEDDSPEKAYARHLISIELGLYRNKMTQGASEIELEHA